MSTDNAAKFTSIEKVQSGFSETGYVCEGLEESKALYEWKYGKQLLYTQILKDCVADLLRDSDSLADSMARLHAYDDIFFSRNFLEPRPLLNALL